MDMNQEQMHPAAAEAAPQSGGGGQEDPTEALMSLLDAMQSLEAGIKDSAPPEAVQALQQAIGAYQQFLDALGAGAGGQQPAAQTDAMAGGK